MIQLHLVTGKKKNRIIKPQITYYKQGSSFDYKAASLYSVAIHLDQSQISLGISNPKTGELLSVEQFQVEGSKSLSFLTQGSVKALLTRSNKNTVYIGTPRFTIIPSVFFNKENIVEISSPIFKTFDQEQLISQFIPEIDSHIVFPMKIDFTQKLKSEIGHSVMAHHFASLISTYHLYYVQDDTETTFVHYHENHFTVALFRNKKMVLFNAFDLGSYEDVIYYTYYSMEQFGFKPSQTAIHLGGYFKDNQTVITTFQKYSESIFQLSPPQLKSIEPEVSDKIISTIFDLQCG